MRTIIAILVLLGALFLASEASAQSLIVRTSPMWCDPGQLATFVGSGAGQTPLNCVAIRSATPPHNWTPLQCPSGTTLQASKVVVTETLSGTFQSSLAANGLLADGSRDIPGTVTVIFHYWTVPINAHIVETLECI